MFISIITFLNWSFYAFPCNNDQCMTIEIFGLLVITERDFESTVLNLSAFAKISQKRFVPEHEIGFTHIQAQN